VSKLSLDQALQFVVEIPDFPIEGVLFRDLNPVLAHADAFAAVIEALSATIPDDTDALVGTEARGFLFAAAVAQHRGLGVVPVRKPGKLPTVAHRVDYALEYGIATLELPTGCLRPGAKAVILDDVLATGGTLAASIELVEHASATVVGVSVVIELADLQGRLKLGKTPVHTLLSV
jgi:adenine phosphoribosyltransferase